MLIEILDKIDLVIKLIDWDIDKIKGWVINATGQSYINLYIYLYLYLYTI